MAYRVEYNGEDIDFATLDAALDRARRVIADDIGRLDGWTVEHDETVNDWFVQGVRNGRRIGPTAVVTGPRGTTTAAAVTGAPTVFEEWERRVVFIGRTPAEAFAMASEWLTRRPDIEALGDVGWHRTADGHQLRLYYR
ncbi:hypothetical protein [Paractinoplanes atraurantiacus]|uniref:Uncharacterized protein n=1 Tax=Paractinoplanes atraurantiacus TaxID=1036182 RepID=A0A285JIW6_9ACTN|nr:hypothetical protein [Actinoplanes atraurantiacus]SNY60215.1 hypothetical protein SAMN05421748_12174 [Actinoplanes atraurantiacus]